jgi:hypothetical protein
MGRLLFAVALLAAIIVAPGPARAALVDVTCAGTETVAYQPGVLLTPQTVQVDVSGVLAPCTSSDSSIASGTYAQHIVAVVSCATLLGPRTATRLLRWSNGHTSAFLYNAAVNNLGGQTTVTFTGTITGGEFQGDTAVEQVAFVTPNVAQCLAPPGLAGLGPGPALLSITHP